ncbi:MAG: hypothetical protein ACFCD0_19880, partial [Gemmataceae bacterium]
MKLGERRPTPTRRLIDVVPGQPYDSFNLIRSLPLLDILRSPMEKRLNIIFSTTRTWNCGDDFILYGILNLFSGIGVQCNPIYYNRNPELLSPIIFMKHSINLTLENQKRQDKL